MEKKQMFILTISLISLALGLFLYLPYRQDIRTAQARLQRVESQIVETACGTIQYATFGEGDPVLVVHGIFGGFDQGLVLARGQVGTDFRSIVPSRFGYLGSPLPDGASPADQADAFACLLDALGIERAAVMGTSAGGTSAIQFALRHPERCSALLLVSSNAPGETEAALPPEPVANTLFKSDFVFWLLNAHLRSTMYSIMGVPAGYEMTPAEERNMAEVAETLLPVAPRAEGALFDMYVSNPDINSGYPLARIAAPTLIVHAKDDPLASYQNAQVMAAQIPGADLLAIPAGGHPLLGHEAQSRTAINTFLEASAARGGSSK